MAVPIDDSQHPIWNANARSVYTKTFRDYVRFLNLQFKQRADPAYTSFIVEYSDRLVFNAIVTPRPDSTFEVRFYDGCALSISELACLLCERRDFLGFLPRPFVRHHAPRYFAVHDYSWLNDSEHTPRAIQWPRAEHLPLFNHIHELCTRFLYWHESAHLQLGHVQSAAGLGAKELAEERSSPYPVPLSQLRQWEMEADKLSMYGLLKAGRDDHHRHTAHIQTSNLLEWDCTVLAACAIVCALFELSEPAVTVAAAARTHPSAAARFLNLLMYYVRLVEGGDVRREPSPASEYYSYLWLQVLTVVAEIRLLTGASATRYEDLKGTLLKKADGVPLTDTANEFIRCSGWTPSADDRDYVPITLPMNFVKPSAIV